jgi:hypothetical protein
LGQFIVFFSKILLKVIYLTELLESVTPQKYNQEEVKLLFVIIFDLCQTISLLCPPKKPMKKAECEEGGRGADYPYQYLKFSMALLVWGTKNLFCRLAQSIESILC